MTEPMSDPVVAAAESRVQQVLDDLKSLEGADPQAQVEAFAAAHRTLAATLSDIDND